MSDDRNQRSLFIPLSAQDHIQGVPSAAVVLVMYGDYQSTQSANLYWLIKAIHQQPSVSFEKHDLCLVFRHFPQSQIHPHAQRAAEAAEAAEAQGQFWPMHEMLFTHSQSLGSGYLVEYADNLGLDIPKFLKDLSRHVYLDRVNQDIESGQQSGVTTAPALFINGFRYHDRWATEQLITAITAAIH